MITAALAAMAGPLLSVLKLAGRVAAYGITIPLGAILAAGLWVHFDKGSAVRSAVDRAVTGLVAGAEIEAARARAEALQKIIDEQARRAERLRLANEQHAALLAESRAREQELSDEIDDLAALPVNDACLVDAGVLGRLRNR